MISFFAPCVPPKTTSQQKRAVRVGDGIRFFKGAKVKAAEDTLQAVLIPFQPEEPLRGLVALDVEFTWPWRAGDINTRAKRERAEREGRIPHGGLPDADNCLKALQDILVTLGFIERDQLVCDVRVRKWFGATPGIKITIKEVGDV